LEITHLFRPDKPVTGEMLRLLPDLSKSTWHLNFGPSDAGEAICCPNCDEGLIDWDSGRFLEGTLIPSDEDTENINESEEAETDQPGAEKKKIDDAKLLEMVDEGKTQVEAANFFGVTKQAISKRIKALRGN